MKTGICKVCGSDKTSPTMIGGSKFKWCNACGQMDMMQTNADRIRAMTDDQLHVLLVDFACNTKKLSQLREWLGQEVE